MAFDDKFKAAGDFTKSFRQLTGKTPELARVVESYKQNMERVVSHWELPLHFFNLGQMARDTILRSVIVISGVPLPSTTEPITDEHLKIYNIFDNIEPAAETVHRMQTELFSSDEWTRLFKGFQPVLASMIVETWTAFETLSEDLWEVAVNRNPERVLRSSYTKPEKEKQFFMPQKQRLNLPIDFDDFVRAFFDLRGKLGTILKSDQQFVFRTYQGIASAYGKAFGKVFHVLDMCKDRSLFDLCRLETLSFTALNSLMNSSGRPCAKITLYILNSMICI